jgi:predicted phage-related endonuclease
MHAKTLFYKNEGDKVQWDRIRATTVNSWEIPIIAGLDDFTSPLKLWMQKTGKTNDRKDSIAAKFGRLSLPILLEIFTDETNETISEPKAVFCHPEQAFAVSTPDAFILNAPNSPDPKAVLHVRGVSDMQMKHWGEEVPLKQQLRLHWDMHVLGLPAGQLGVVVQQRELKRFEIERDDDAVSQSLELAEFFLDRVQRDIPPGAGPGDSKNIEAMLGERSADTHDFGEDERIAGIIDKITELGDRRRKLEKEAGALEDEEKSLKNQLALEMGAHGRARVGYPGELIECFFTAKVITVKERIQKGYSYTLMNFKRGNR